MNARPTTRKTMDELNREASHELQRAWIDTHDIASMDQHEVLAQLDALKDEARSIAARRAQDATDAELAEASARLGYPVRHCRNCGGDGWFQHLGHIEAGVCFSCRGRKYVKA